MNVFEMLFKPIIDFFNALFGLAVDFLMALQDLMNNLFEAIGRLFGG